MQMLVWLEIIIEIWFQKNFMDGVNARIQKIFFSGIIIAIIFSILWTIYYHLSEGLSFIGCFINLLLLALTVLYLNSWYKKSIRLNQ
ncbi:MAG: hypothetical protein QF365_03305 [Candidatus Thalassarchaeaceae archaeon]|nr:hypothetical protein [Candidatus Thalassarchaeaceae archaeon]